MKYIFYLSGDYTSLAREEVVSLLDARNDRLSGRLMIADVDFGKPKNGLHKAFRRLALTKSACKLLFECKASELESFMADFDWNAVYKGDFCVRIKLCEEVASKITKTGNLFSEKDLAGSIWHSVRKPKVNLESPKTRIEIFVGEAKAYCGLLVYENKEDFESRKPHLRAFTHPSSLHPKLSRALVNITGIKDGNALLDPFCGTGGFLIEAGLMGIKGFGYDISRNVAAGCRKNLEFLKIKNCRVTSKNALHMGKKFEYVVSDMPYGLNSNIYLEYDGKSIKQKSNRISLKSDKNSANDIEKFYLLFLKKLRKILEKRAVIIFPGYADYRKLLKQADFGIEKEFEIYAHRSLSRKIVRIA